MGRITLEQAAAWCGGTIDSRYKDITFFGAANDSRKIEAGQLFVALQGERDGHTFIPNAMEKGAAAVLCTHCDGDYPAIVVPDTRVALGNIARQERLRLGMKVVGITGSVGKSTTKEMIACVLQGTYRVSKTPANHNNDIGLPMSILAMPEDTQVAVLEMGMNHFREIAYLTEIAKPDIAVIINIGTMHIEHLGSMEGILQAKLEILEGMKPDSKVILNADDPLLWNLHKRKSFHPIYFGIQNDHCSVRGEDVEEDAEGIRFQVGYANGEFSVALPLEGEHYVLDALAAVSVGLELGVKAEEIRKRLLGFQNMQGRQEIYEKNGFTIIQDCYNAGPESMAAALQVLGNRSGRRVAVLGDMLELGTCATAEHYRIGRNAAEKCDLLFAYGKYSQEIRNGAITGGMDQNKIYPVDSHERLAKLLKEKAKPQDVILFKGSRGMRMELALEMFLQEEK